MDYTIEVRPLAALEIIEAYDWYELQQAGLGTRFLDAVDIFFNSLRRNPKMYSYYDETTRQGRLKTFPYLVVYEIFDANIVVYTVFMAKQDPSKKRIL